MCSISERTRFRSIALPHYPLDCADEPFRPALELVVETKPPEQDLDFTIAFHKADNSTNHERIGKPLGIGGLIVRSPKLAGTLRSPRRRFLAPALPPNVRREKTPQMGWRPWCALHRGRFARLEMTVWIYDQGEELKDLRH